MNQLKRGKSMCNEEIENLSDVLCTELYKALMHHASRHFSYVLKNTQVLYNCTQHSSQVFYFFYKIQIIEKFCACCGQL
jgi:hypothetical protein